MGITEDLAAICRSTRQSQGKSLEAFYGTGKTARSWGYRLENPNGLHLRDGKRQGSPMHEKVAGIIDRLGLTLAPTTDSDSCWADVERTIKGLQTIPEHDREMVLAAALGVFSQAYQKSVMDGGDC